MINHPALGDPPWRQGHRQSNGHTSEQIPGLSTGGWAVSAPSKTRGYQGALGSMGSSWVMNGN